MGLRLCHREHHKSLIDIRHCRADQLILSRKDLCDISFHILFVKDLNLDVIPHERFDPLLPERAFCLTLINTGSCCVNVVESGDTFYNFSLHDITASHDQFVFSVSESPSEVSPPGVSGPRLTVNPTEVPSATSLPGLIVWFMTYPGVILLL